MKDWSYFFALMAIVAGALIIQGNDPTVILQLFALAMAGGFGLLALGYIALRTVHPRTSAPAEHDPQALVSETDYRAWVRAHPELVEKYVSEKWKH
jgi:hypothetical protein